MDVREFFPGAPGSGLIRSGEERSTLAAQGQSGPSEEGDLMSVAFVPPVTQWRAAAAFSAAHVALMIAGLAISGGGALLEEGTQGITGAYVNADLTPILGGWLLEPLAFLLLIPVVVFLAGAVGHTPAGRLVARTGLVSASIYVGITLAVGFPPVPPPRTARSTASTWRPPPPSPVSASLPTSSACCASARTP